MFPIDLLVIGPLRSCFILRKLLIKSRFSVKMVPLSNFWFSSFLSYTSNWICYKMQLQLSLTAVTIIIIERCNACVNESSFSLACLSVTVLLELHASRINLQHVIRHIKLLRLKHNNKDGNLQFKLFLGINGSSSIADSTSGFILMHMRNCIGHGRTLCSY